MRASQDALGYRRAEIDALNVFPVPDGDTGTNMYPTIEAAAIAAVEVSDPASTPVPPPTRARPRALSAPAGNSGVILSQLLRGMADVIPGRLDEPTGGTLAEALARAADPRILGGEQACGGHRPHRRAAAANGAAEHAAAGVTAVARAAAQHAHDALARTPPQLPALAAAGVVDAGGKGLVVVLDALVEVLTGEAHVDATSPVTRRSSRTSRCPLETSRVRATR